MPSILSYILTSPYNAKASCAKALACPGVGRRRRAWRELPTGISFGHERPDRQASEKTSEHRGTEALARGLEAMEDRSKRGGDGGSCARGAIAGARTRFGGSGSRRSGAPRGATRRQHLNERSHRVALSVTSSFSRPRAARSPAIRTTSASRTSRQSRLIPTTRASFTSRSPARARARERTSWT